MQINQTHNNQRPVKKGDTPWIEQHLPHTQV
jgi:hypothetical protein